VVTVRFETRGSGPGPARTFSAGPSDTTDISPANPVDSLDWPDYVAAIARTASEQAVDDVAQR
jgi:DNA polymerase-4